MYNTSKDFSFEVLDRIPITGRDIAIRDRAIEIFNNKLIRKVEYNAKVYDKLVTDEQTLNDYIVPFNELRFDVNEGGYIGQHLTYKGGAASTRLIDNGLNHFTNKLDINPKYLKGLINSRTEWGTKLAERIMNDHASHSNKKVLVRSTGDETRGILSDTYDRYSTLAIINHVMKVTKGNVYISNISYDGLTVSIEIVSKKIVPVNINGQVVFMIFGAHIRNSSFGTSALDVRTFTIQMICSNGMTGTRNLREVHRAGRIMANGMLSNDTLIARAEYKKGLITDGLNHVFSTQNITNSVLSMEAAGSTEIDMEIAIKKLAKQKIQQSEIKEINDIILNNHETDGLTNSPTLFKLSQAVGAVAREKPTSRRLELMDIAGNIINIQ